MPEGTTFICTNNSTQVKTPWTTQPSYRSGGRRVLSPRDEGVKNANQSQNNSEGPCEDDGGNRYKSIYIHSKTSPLST